MKQTSGIRAAVFDLDGTLIDSMEIWREVDEDFFARRGMAVPEGYQERIAHLGFRECAAFTVREYLPNESEVDIIEEWRALSLSKYSAADGAKYFKPGAIAFVRRLREKGIRLGVAPAECAVFEDNLAALRAAKGTGMFAVGVFDEASRAFHAEMEREADLFIRSFEDLRDIF